MKATVPRLREANVSASWRTDGRRPAGDLPSAVPSRAAQHPPFTAGSAFAGPEEPQEATVSELPAGRIAVPRIRKDVGGIALDIAARPDRDNAHATACRSWH
ncbi:hypothetical protein GCM10023322_76120 [Rugosimonospora acidiphila]|uniref:Uncharacterized protein n=1 Tax=Rugosimonospora acidiphila TaxID=556531 RepID=A0ABP9SR71_9ACTN